MINVVGEDKTMDVSVDTAFDAVAGYSYIKQWEVDNIEHTSPITAIGKAPLGGGVYTDSIFIISNGWKIRPSGYTAGTLITIKGTLITDDNTSPVTPAVVGSPVNWLIQATTAATVVTTGSGVTAQDKIDIANATIEAGVLTEDNFLGLK